MDDRTSFRDRVSAALFDDFLVRGDDENDRMIAEIKRLRAIEKRAETLADLLFDPASRETARRIFAGNDGD